MCVLPHTPEGGVGNTRSPGNAHPLFLSLSTTPSTYPSISRRIAHTYREQQVFPALLGTGIQLFVCLWSESLWRKAAFLVPGKMMTMKQEFFLYFSWIINYFSFKMLLVVYSVILGASRSLYLPMICSGYGTIKALYHNLYISIIIEAMTVQGVRVQGSFLWEGFYMSTELISLCTLNIGQ